MLLGKIAYLTGLVLQITIRYPYRENRKTDRSDRQEQILLLLLAIGGMLLPFIYVFTDWLAFADYPASPIVVGAGIVVMAVGLYFFWRAHRDLGRNWSSSLEIHEEHALITEGIYARIRHPMYSASWLMMLGQALVLSNWLAGLGGIVTFALLYFLRVPREEAMMLEAFGDPYRQYMTRTGRVFPKGGTGGEVA